MQPDFWLERWQRNEIGFHQQAINASLRMCWSSLGLPADAKVFVPLCGKSRDMLWLRARGHAVLGVELIEIAVRDFFTENRLTPRIAAQPPFTRYEAEGITLLRGDFFDLAAADLEDVAGVYDRASLIAMPRNLRERYVAKLAEILPPAAESLLITLSYPEGELRGPPFCVTEEEVRALYADDFRVELVSTEDALAEHPHFHARGLTRLTEQVYRVRKRPA